MQIQKSREHFIPVLVFYLLFLNGCDFLKKESCIEKDRKEQQEIIDGLFATYWKGAKIAFRSLPIDANTKTIDFSEIKKRQVRELNLGKHLSRIYDFEFFLKDIDRDIEPLAAKEFVEFAKEVFDMAETIEHMDEDAYPTFAEIIHHSNRVLKREDIGLPDYWNNSIDHWMFALTMETRAFPGSWKTYELAKVFPKDMETSDYRIAANLHKGINHLGNQWYCLADESFSKAIAETDSPDISLQPCIKGLLDEAKIEGFSDEELFRLLARASSHLLRGFSRHRADSSELNEKALGDIESAIADFHRLGIENELVWIAESYVYIVNEKTEKAIASLTKLENSKFFCKKELKLIARAKEHIKNRDPESALNFLTDKFIAYELCLDYAMGYAYEIQWMRLLEKTEQGKKILKRFSELEQIYEKARSHLDRFKEKGKSLLKKMSE